ncbi:amino acid permease [Candidatus Clostridium radicumherbarum]|uniref:Amino acid permease n=1 Tax=Candidatus Clostridium radicumherbarum TaxID=3381662 RepID=A0ABW8TND4_9CLOT
MAESNSNSKGSGKESLGKITALLLTSAMMVGTGIYTTLGAATAKAQSGILISMIIGVIIVLLTAISAAQVGVNYSEEGGAFIWMRIFGYPSISFTAGISYLIKGMVGLGIPSLGLASYSAVVFPGLPVPLVASIALLIVAAVNFLGITPTAKVIIGIFFVNLVLLLLYVSFSVPSVEISNFTPIFGTGITGIMSGAAAFFWSWDGFQRTAIMADVIKNPKKSIPFAIIGGILITAIIYLLVAGTTLGVLGADALGQSDAPLLLGAKKAMLGWGIGIIILSVGILTFSDILGDMMSTSKVGHAMGQEHELPHWLGRVNKQFKSPQFVIVLLTIVGLILINLVPLRKLTTVASASTLFWYIITNISALKLNKDRLFAWPIISWLGIAACLALFFSLPLWSTLGTIGFIALLVGIRWLFIRIIQKSVVDTGGNWSVSGLTLAQGDLISVTAQYAGETKSTEVTSIVAEAPLQTTAPVISRNVTAADTTVTGKAPSDSSVLFSINGVAQTAVVATGGNWAVSGLKLSQGDIISVTAQSVGETVSTQTTMTVAPAPIETSEPAISGVVTVADTTVSGRAPSGASVVLSVNGKAQPAVVAANGSWTVSGLKLSKEDLISVSVQHGDETVNTSTEMKVITAPLQTGEPLITKVVTAADTTVSGRAPVGANIVLSINGKAQPAVIATSGKIEGTGATMTVAAAPLETAVPAISGLVTASDTTISGSAISGASVVLSVNGVSKSAVVATGGNWMVSGLTLSQNDLISVTAQSAGNAVSLPLTTTVAPAPHQTAVPVISGIIKSADKTVSGTAPSGASVVLSLNGKAQPAVVATGGNWIVAGLTLTKGDSINVTAQAVGETVSAPAAIQVQ